MRSLSNCCVNVVVVADVADSYVVLYEEEEVLIHQSKQNKKIGEGAQSPDANSEHAAIGQRRHLKPSGG